MLTRVLFAEKCTICSFKSSDSTMAKASPGAPAVPVFLQHWKVSEFEEVSVLIALDSMLTLELSTK